MNTITTLTALLLGGIALAVQPVVAGEKVPADEMGLSKTSVFATPTPQAPTYPTSPPGTVEPLPRAFPDAPPQIPHEIATLLPITRANNACLQCHDKPYLIGQELPPTQPTPMPTSHYTDLRNNPDLVTGKVIGSRFVCSQCHAAQAEAPPLVENTFVVEEK
jgi:cytochrome c-type protein NapB